MMIAQYVRIIKTGSDYIYHVILLILATILCKNPCKNCLVSPCCSAHCEEKIAYLDMGGINGVGFQKFTAWCIVFSIFTIIFGIVTCSVK